MGKAGGIVGLIAGIFGIIAAVITLFAGGIVSAFGSKDGSTVVGLGWGGLVCSLLVIIFASIALSNHRVGGILMGASALLGTAIGGTPVAICMYLALVAALLCALAGKRQAAAVSSQISEDVSSNSAAPGTSGPPRGVRNLLIAIGGALLIAIALAIVVGLGASNTGTAQSGGTELGQLASASPANLSPIGELAQMFTLMSDYTDLQRENKLKEIEGQVVSWTLPVYDVHRDGEGYKIQTIADAEVGTFIYMSAPDNDGRHFIEGLKTGDRVPFKGKIEGSLLRHLVIRPAILNVRPERAVTPAASIPAVTLETRTEKTPLATSAIMPYIGRTPDDAFFKLPGIPQVFDRFFHEGFTRLTETGGWNDEFAIWFTHTTFDKCDLEDGHILVISWNATVSNGIDGNILAIDLSTGEAVFGSQENDPGIIFRGDSGACKVEALPKRLQKWIKDQQSEAAESAHISVDQVSVKCDAGK